MQEFHPEKIEDQDPPLVAPAVENGSILDTIISHRHSEIADQFRPSAVVQDLLGMLKEKERFVIERRFGLNEKEKETLEMIGSALNLTRERIRQIERSVIKKFRNIQNSPALLSQAERVIHEALREHGGAMETQTLFAAVLDHRASDQNEGRALHLLLDEVFVKQFLRITEDTVFRNGYRLPTIELSYLGGLFQAANDILEQEGKPLDAETLMKRMEETSWYTTQESRPSRDVLLNFLRLSRAIRTNAFSAWGKTSWPTITPKRMNDKIYLILKEAGEPLHFTVIAKKINDAAFDHKIAYPATIHNELILDERYVLVGRGMYALKEWGYKPGVVADVVEDVLRSAGRPMTREEVVRAVLKQRKVTESTIYLALLSKERFVHHADGTFGLQEKIVNDPVHSPTMSSDIDVREEENHESPKHPDDSSGATEQARIVNHE